MGTSSVLATSGKSFSPRCRSRSHATRLVGHNAVRTIVPGPCPYCDPEIEYLYKTENIPYFSDILIISAICPSCGYRFVDTQLLKNADPVRYDSGLRPAKILMFVWSGA